jgi:hypothetical protein
VSTIVKWGLIALIVWWVVTSPSGADLAVHHVGSLATTVAGGLTKFASGI